MNCKGRSSGSDTIWGPLNIKMWSYLYRIPISNIRLCLVTRQSDLYDGSTLTRKDGFYIEEGPWSVNTIDICISFMEEQQPTLL